MTKLGLNFGGWITFPIASRMGCLEVHYVTAGGGSDMFPTTFGLRL